MTDVLLLHAGIADSRMWEPQRAALEATGRRVVAPDLRGFGSRPLEHGRFSYVADAASLLEGPTDVVGCSLGGRVALELALARPELVSRLVLVAPGLPGWQWSDETRAGWAEEGTAFEQGDLEAAAEASVRMWIDGPRRRAEDVDPSVRALVREMVLRSYELQPIEPEEEDLDPPAIARLADVRKPTLIAVGSEDLDDMHGIAKHLAAEIEGARLVVIEGAGHLPGLERPDAVNRLLLDFLDDL